MLDFIPLRKLFDLKKNLLNGWCLLDNADVAQLIISKEIDTLTIDLQHGLISYDSLKSLMNAVAFAQKPILSRVPSRKSDLIAKSLDLGAHGIICPMINSKEDAGQFVEACFYPPAGTRSYGPVGAGLKYTDNYWSQISKEISTFAMIETVDGLEQLDSILDVEGLAGIYIGPNDLSLACGVAPSSFPTNKTVKAAIQEIKIRCHRAGKKVGIHGEGLNSTIAWLSDDFDIITIGSDLGFLSAGVDSLFQKLNSLSKI